MIAIVGALSVLVEKVRRDLAKNTNITEEAKAAANGQLSAALDELARTRNLVVGLRAVVRERDDRIAFVVARHPEVEQTLARYGDRRTRRASELEEARALDRFADDDIDDPTGTDAGAHPRG